MIEPCINPETGRYTDDYLIAKAFECLRLRFRERLPVRFFEANWNRAKLVLQVEGRSVEHIVNALLPFAEAQTSETYMHPSRMSDEMRGKYPHMCRLIELGLL